MSFTLETTSPSLTNPTLTSPTLWPRSPVPRTSGTAWQWQITSLRQLSGVRAELRARLRSAARAAGANGDEVADRVLLAVEELASNGLRHGVDPVEARVVATADGWLIVISDGAIEQGPQPAVGRDPALGGMGLYLVAELSAARGWAVTGGRKHVWACLPAA